MDWMPNEDGVQWFVDDVLPLVARALFGRDLYDRRPPSDAGVKPLVAARAITVTGSVPDVGRTWNAPPFCGAACASVGEHDSRSTKAMAMERAVVSTTIGAEGLPLTDGEEIMLADDASAFADGHL